MSRERPPSTVVSRIRGWKPARTRLTGSHRAPARRPRLASSERSTDRTRTCCPGGRRAHELRPRGSPSDRGAYPAPYAQRAADRVRAYARHNATMARHIPVATFATPAANRTADHDLVDTAHRDGCARSNAKEN